VIRIAFVAAAGLLPAACGVPDYVSEADRDFDRRVLAIPSTARVVTLRDLEAGSWTHVCSIGEERPNAVLRRAGLPQRAAEGEAALDELFDPAFDFTGWGSSALVFVQPGGAEVRPVTALHFNMQSSVCRTREQAMLVRSDEGGWTWPGLGEDGER
jgi:hypothetical protein